MGNRLFVFGDSLENVFVLILGRDGVVGPDEFLFVEEIGKAGGLVVRVRDAEGVADGTGGVAEEREGDLELVCEVTLGGHVVHGDSDDADAVLFEHACRRPEALDLFGSSGGVGARIEEDEEVFFGGVVAEGDLAPVLVGGGDIREGDLVFFADKEA